MKNKVISLRINPEELAKARDCLISKGIDPLELITTSSIVKLTFYYGIMYLCEDPTEPASRESLDFIKQKLRWRK